MSTSVQRGCAAVATARGDLCTRGEKNAPCVIGAPGCRETKSTFVGLMRSDGMNGFVAARTLTEYPRGAYRWALLLLTVLASILGAYDFQLAPLLPIMLPYLHMSHVAYGKFITAAVMISGISAFVGGPLADRYGRVLIIDVCLGLVTGLLFLNVLITGIVSFVILRTSMGIVAGLTAGALAA